MNIPKISVNNISQTATNKIIKASQKPSSLGEQAVMANYYAYLKSKAETAAVDFAKINLAK